MIYHFKNWKGSLLPVLFLLFSLDCFSQYIVGLHSRWEDSFHEWVILGEYEDDDGLLETRWKLKNDWTEWNFTFSGISGDIIMRHKSNPGFWETRSNGLLVTARAIWPQDPTQWQITFGNYKLILKTRFGLIGDEWLVDDEKAGTFYMYTEWEGDPRSWIIEDNLEENIPVLVKIAMIHTVIMQSIPRK